MALNQGARTNEGGQRVDFSGVFFNWLRRHVGLWMSIVWIPIFLFAPAADLVAMVQDGETPAWPIGLAVVLLAGLAATFAGSVIPTSHGRRGFGVEASLVLLAALACASTVSFSWAGAFTLPAIACGVVVPMHRVLPVILLITFSAGALVWVVDGSPGSALSAMILTFLVGLGNFVIHRLATVIAELDAARSELARAAVFAERARFARDLHDLLGHTLSVIVVKAEATRRLAANDPDAAAGHAADIESIGRNALSEVRDVVSGYRSTSLAAELEGARGTLTVAGIRPEIRNEAIRLPDDIEGLLGWVVREGATNVVRHSGAGKCSIAIERSGDNVVVDINDDGTGSAAPDSAEPDSGWGLAGLRERAAACGGQLTTSAHDDGFRLTVEVPARETRTAGR